MAKYKLLSVINEGGFGIIHRVEREDGTVWALKKLKPSTDEEARRRFCREVKLQSTLSHPNVMPIAESNLNADPPFFVMPLATCSLRDSIPSIQGDTTRIVSIARAVLDGLEYAHKNNVIHRDLKPENILFFDGGRPVIADFGLGRPFIRDTTTLTATNLGLGTVAYMAPEQWDMAKEAGTAADIYAFGKILYEMITGKMPYPDVDRNLLDVRQRYIVERCTEKDPAQRFANARELIAEIELFFTQPTAIEVPRDRVLQLIGEGAVDDLPDEQVRELVRLLHDHMDDDSLMLQVVPRLPATILEEMMRLEWDRFREVLQTFDRAVSDNLAFEFTDVVADFYERLYGLTEDFGVRIMIINRLHDMGWRHHRFHVGQVLSRILATVRDPAFGRKVAQELSQSPACCDFVREYVSASSILPEIRAAVERDR